MDILFMWLNCWQLIVTLNHFKFWKQCFTFFVFRIFYEYFQLRCDFSTSSLRFSCATIFFLIISINHEFTMFARSVDLKDVMMILIDHINVFHSYFMHEHFERLTLNFCKWNHHFRFCRFFAIDFWFCNSM